MSTPRWSLGTPPFTKTKKLTLQIGVTEGVCPQGAKQASTTTELRPNTTKGLNKKLKQVWQCYFLYTAFMFCFYQGHRFTF